MENLDWIKVTKLEVALFSQLAAFMSLPTFNKTIYKD